jgi:hypothetical protein
MHRDSKKWIKAIEAGGAAAQSEDECIMHKGVLVSRTEIVPWRSREFREFF